MHTKAFNLAETIALLAVAVIIIDGLAISLASLT